MSRSDGSKHKPGEQCPRCGIVHLTASGAPACIGHSRTPPHRACRRAPNDGHDVCWTHGAASPQAQAAGERRVTDRKATELMRRFGEPIDTSPTEALLDTVKWTAGYVAWLRDKVATVTSDERLVWGQTKRTTGNSASVTHEAAVNPWLTLLGEWSDRLVKVCTAAISAGIEERRVRLAEAQGALVAEVIRKILGDLNLTPEQARKAGEVVPFRLREAAS